MSRPSIWQQLQEQIADTKSRLAHLEEMIKRREVRLIHVKPASVKAHTRAGYTRAYYPPRRKSQ